MVIVLKVIPGARKDLLKEEHGQIKVYLTAPPLDGRANEALLRFLAGHFGVKPAAVTLIKGLKSRHKVVNIAGI